MTARPLPILPQMRRFLAGKRPCAAPRPATKAYLRAAGTVGRQSGDSNAAQRRAREAVYRDVCSLAKRFTEVGWAVRIAARGAVPVGEAAVAAAGASAAPPAGAAIEEVNQAEDNAAFAEAKLAARALLLGEVRVAAEQAHVRLSQVHDALSYRRSLKKETAVQRSVQGQAVQNLNTYFDRIELLEAGGFLGLPALSGRRRERCLKRFLRGDFAWNDGVEGGGDDDLAEDGVVEAACAEADQIKEANFGCACMSALAEEPACDARLTYFFCSPAILSPGHPDFCTRRRRQLERLQMGAERCQEEIALCLWEMSSVLLHLEARVASIKAYLAQPLVMSYSAPLRTPNLHHSQSYAAVIRPRRRVLSWTSQVALTERDKADHLAESKLQEVAKLQACE